MKQENKILRKNQLSKLIKRFQDSYVVEEMEKNFRQAKSEQLLINEIDDNSIIKSAIIKDETLKNIAEDIDKKGFSNPLIVRQKKNFYEIIFGRKRLLACKKYHILKAPVVVTNVNDEEMLFMLLANNRETRDSNIIETALVLGELSKTYKYSQKTLAELSHQSRSQITNILRLLNLPQHIIDDISIGRLSYGHAKAIASLPETKIENLVSRIYKDNLSVRETEKLVKDNEENKVKKDIVLNKYQCKLNHNEKEISLSFDSKEDKEKFLNEILNKQ